MKVAIGSDHAGYDYKEMIKKYLEEKGFEVIDKGTYSNERTDYPVYAEKVAKAVANGEADRGILICGTGIGMSITANKIKGVRAALAYRVQGFPTILVFDPTKNYELLTYINGYISKRDFGNLLDFIGSGCYKKTDYETFIKNNKKC